MTDLVRRLAGLTEVLHAVVYFAPEPAERYAALGLRGYWRGYFASRAAALGPASPELVTAVFGGFAPAMVARALPQVWSLASPADVLRARADGATAALRRLLDPGAGADLVATAALTSRAVAGLDLAGRPMAAAALATARPDDPLGGLWHDCTVLREHRGDGHLAAVAVEGLRWPEPHLLLAGLRRVDPRQQEHRGWDDAQWSAARRRLQDRGQLDEHGAATRAGAAAADRVEQLTDRLAAPAYDGVDAPALAAALQPLAAAVVRGGGLPFPNAMGLPPPRG